MSVWGGVLSSLLGLVEYHYRTGTDLDRDYFDSDLITSLECAAPVAQVLAAHGVTVPDEDRFLIARLERGGQSTQARSGWWKLVATPDGRVGVTCPQGVVESNGGHMALVTAPEADRYDRWFCLPGVWYPRSTTAAGEAEQAALRGGGGL